MRKEDKMTGKNNIKRYYHPKYREGGVWVIRDRENGSQVAIINGKRCAYYTRDEARYEMRRLGAIGLGGARTPPGHDVLETPETRGV